MHHHTHHRSWILSFAAILLAFTIATPVLAEYIGPQRTVTETYNVCRVVLNECKYVEDKAEWRYKTEETWSCSLESKPWQAYSSQSRACNNTNHTPGYQYWSKEDVPKTETVTHPPATISSSLQNCTLQNGWCTTLPQLALSGLEPVPGHSIIAIEGTRNGQTFACTGATCNVSLVQGNNNFTYWALSSFLDSSEMGNFTAKVDSQAPTITGSFTGTLGLNGWYLGPVTLTSMASDTASGLASVACTRDGLQVIPCAVIALNTDGPHTIVISARDNAGHLRTVTQNASIDTKDPVLTASINGTLGANDWYTAATLNASATDPTPGSGLSLFQYNADGGAWTTFPASNTLSLTDGKHTVNLLAVDTAGRIVTSSTSYWLDTTAPEARLDADGTFGLNDWYILSPTISASASDLTSGLDVLEYSLDQNDWVTYTAPFPLTDGVYTVGLWAQDQAGLVTQVERTYRVDTRPPQIAGSLSGVPGTNGWYISEVTVFASAADPAPGSGIDTFTYTLDGADETPYIDPVTFVDGKHKLQLRARDSAGHPHVIEQTFDVDTIPPSLARETVLSDWVKGLVTLAGTAYDAGSGPSTVEVSLDGGQTWQAVNGTTAWNYTWDTSAETDGAQQVHLRAADVAGLVTQQTIDANVDNHPPEISLPDSWLQWDTVTLNVLDQYSGLSEARLEISDPKGRWPTRVISLDPAQFPLQFKWDRRFGDGTVADAGTYAVKVLALDRLGHQSEKTASIHVLLEILPPGPTSTPQTHVPTVTSQTATHVVSPTATPIRSETQISSPTSSVNTIGPSPTATQVITIRVFGTIEPPLQATVTARATSTPRATPTQSNAVEWLQSIIVPLDTQESVTPFGSPEEPAPVTNSSVLWGTAAAAAIGAATAYAQEEKRKREEEKARLEALEEAEEERRENRKEQKIAKMDAKRAQEAAWEAARQEELYGSSLQTDIKVARMEAQEGALQELKKAPPATTQRPPSSIYDRRAEAKDETIQEQEKSFYTTKTEDWKADFDAYMAQRAALAKEKEKEDVAPPEKKTWWDNAKSLTNKFLIEPLNTHVYQPLVKPDLEKMAEAATSVASWLDKKVYQPHIQPVVERGNEFIKNEFEWINKNIYEPVVQPALTKVNEAIAATITLAKDKIYQPYIQPAVNKVVQDVSRDLETFKEKVYRPYIQPVVNVVKEKIYEPYVQPVVKKVSEQVNKAVSWTNENIYKPYFEPVVSDINKHIYQPLANKVTNWWGQYGEWVHGALDAVGFIPGFGEIADGLNGVIYLAEGRTLEAGLSLMSMIPIIGDLGKGGKWAIKAGQEVVDTVVGKVAKEVAGESLQKAAKELLEEGAENAAKDANEWVYAALDLVGCIPGASTHTTKIESLLKLAEGRYIDATITAATTIPVVGDFISVGKEIVESSLQRVIKKTAEEMREEATEVIIREVKEELLEKIVKESGEELLENATKNVVEENLDKVVTKFQKELKEDAFVDKLTAQETETTTSLTENAVSEDRILTNQQQIDKEITQRVVNTVVEGKVTSLPQDIAEQLTAESANKLAQEISNELGGKKVWVSAQTGSIYVSTPPAEGFVLAEQLSKTDLTKTDEVEKILKEVARLTSRGSGDHVVLGPFKPNGTFIQEALDTDGVFWDVGDELWNALEKTGIDMFKANDQFLRVQLENEIDRFDVINTDVNRLINDFNNSAPKDWSRIKYTEKEVLALASMPDIPYQLVNNSWVRVDVINSK